MLFFRFEGVLKCLRVLRRVFNVKTCFMEFYLSLNRFLYDWMCFECLKVFARCLKVFLYVLRVFYGVAMC